MKKNSIVTLKRKHSGFPKGTTGTIVNQHENAEADIFEVEFYYNDCHNTITVSGKDLELRKDI